MTLVTGTVISSNGFPFINCSVSAIFVPSPTATLAPSFGPAGQTFQTVIPVAMGNGSGHFSVFDVADNNLVVDGHAMGQTSSQWRFNICTSPSICCQPQICFDWIGVITGTVMDISAQLKAVAPAICSPCGTAPISPGGPMITAISPNTGPTGIKATVTGSGFGATQGTSTITVNGVLMPVSSWSDTSITVTIPSGATTGNVVVTVNGVPSNGVTFTVTGAPSITSLSPTSGPVGGNVTITGLNFGATQGTSTVTFNGTAATIVSWSATSIVATVPAGATTGPVIVKVAGVNSNSVTFTVTAAPHINTLTPNAGAVGATVVVAGVNFGGTQGTSTITLNGVPI